MFRIIRPAAYDYARLTRPQIVAVADLQPDWIYFGTLFHTSKRALDATLQLLAKVPSAKGFYDVNLRDGNWNLATVEQLAAHAHVIKLSDSEAECLDASLSVDGDAGSVEHFCQRWSDQYNCKTICVTFGERGCGVYKDCVYTAVPGCKVEVADTVGAGDAFAAAFLHGLETGLGGAPMRKFRERRSRAGGQPSRRDSGVERGGSAGDDGDGREEAVRSARWPLISCHPERSVRVFFRSASFCGTGGREVEGPAVGSRWLRCGRQAGPSARTKVLGRDDTLERRDETLKQRRPAAGRKDNHCRGA